MWGLFIYFLYFDFLFLHLAQQPERGGFSVTKWQDSKNKAVESQPVWVDSLWVWSTWRCRKGFRTTERAAPEHVTPQLKMIKNVPKLWDVTFYLECNPGWLLSTQFKVQKINLLQRPPGAWRSFRCSLTGWPARGSIRRGGWRRLQGRAGHLSTRSLILSCQQNNLQDKNKGRKWQKKVTGGQQDDANTA